MRLKTVLRYLTVPNRYASMTPKDWLIDKGVVKLGGLLPCVTFFKQL